MKDFPIGIRKWGGGGGAGQGTEKEMRGSSIRSPKPSIERATRGASWHWKLILKSKDKSSVSRVKSTTTTISTRRESTIAPQDGEGRTEMGNSVTENQGREIKNTQKSKV